MNEKTDIADQPEAGSGKAEKAEDGPSSGLSHTQTAERHSFFERFASLFRRRNGSSLREDLEDALLEAAPEGEAFSPSERAMLNNILRLREVRVEDVMVPRADIEAVETDTTLGEAMNIFEASGHSRMPVYEESLDDAKGMIHIRDLLAHITRSARVKKSRSRKAAANAALDLSSVDLNKTIGELNLIRSVLFVPPSMLASDLMAQMQTTRTQMALVIDEYGGTDGLVSMEDIVETVVGDIEDEHDEEEALITTAPDGSYIVDAKAEIEDVAEAIGRDFAPGEHGEYVDTIGGLIFNALGRVPVRGEVVQPIPGFDFHVLDADPRRVKRVRIVHSVKLDKRRRARQEQEHD
ncbi:MAG: HlyC/CorC family transporter [Rhizobiaceae bacterium]|nr:HlyC/CorC family transporter [Rhizobiaceae bacterium]